MIPRAAVDEVMATSPEFRRFLFQAYSRRITDLFLTVKEIAFGRMDARLAAKLLELSGGTAVRASPRPMRRWRPSWAPRARWCPVRWPSSRGAAGWSSAGARWN